MELVAIAGACALTAGGLAVAEKTAPRMHRWRMKRLDKKLERLEAKAVAAKVVAAHPNTEAPVAARKERMAERYALKARIVKRRKETAPEVHEVQAVCRKGWQTMLAAAAAFAVILYPVEALLITLAGYLATQVYTTAVGYQILRKEGALFGPINPWTVQ